MFFVRIFNNTAVEEEKNITAVHKTASLKRITVVWKNEDKILSVKNPAVDKSGQIGHRTKIKENKQCHNIIL